MSRKSSPIQIIVHRPSTPEGKEALARQIADVHVSAVNQKLKSMNCPEQQKLELLDAVIRTVKEQSREQT